MAAALAAQGAKVAIVGRSAERGQERVKAIRDAGGTAEFFTADALSADSLAACRDAVVKQLGIPTTLLNAAGGNRPRQLCHRVRTSANYRSTRGKTFSI